jgi:hypothetical protein
MPVDQFDLNDIRNVEFGVCKETDAGKNFSLIPIHVSVKDILKSILLNTQNALELESGEAFGIYEPSQLYGSKARLKLPLADATAESARNLFNAASIATDPEALSDLSYLIYYFAVFYDGSNRKLIAVRRTSQFKGIVKARSRIVSWINQTLKLVEEELFKLDADFDYLFTAENVFILRPSGFELTADIDEIVIAKAAENTLSLGQQIRFVDFDNLVDFVKRHKRAARLVASIKSHGDLGRIKRAKFLKHCKDCNVGCVQSAGKVYPVAGSEFDFLNILDRRLYLMNLTSGSEPEVYEANSRHKLIKGS